VFRPKVISVGDEEYRMSRISDCFSLSSGFSDLPREFGVFAIREKLTK
jgi:hypothetical protein